MKKVSVIIVNWNGLHHLKKCLPSLVKNTYSSYEIIIVDNASHDGSIEYIKKNFPKIKLVINKKNEGFAGGNNAGYKYAKGEYILLLNNDTHVPKDMIEKMVFAMEKEKNRGIIQSKLILMDDPKKLDSVGGYFTDTGFLYHFGYLQKDSKKYDRVFTLYTVKGACMMIKREVIEKVGLFDDDYFAYFEETDLCHRAWLAGYTVAYDPSTFVYHKVGGTSNAMDNAFIQYHSFKNRINTYLKNLGTAELIKVLPMHILLCEIAAWGFLLRGKSQHFVAIHKAYWWNIQTFRQTLKKRKRIQHTMRKVQDSEFLPKVKKNLGLRYYYYLFFKNLQGYNDEKN